MLVENVEADGTAEGRAAHQGPEVDGTTRIESAGSPLRIGDLVPARVVGTDGVDLVATATGEAR